MMQPAPPGMGVQPAPGAFLGAPAPVPVPGTSGQPVPGGPQQPRRPKRRVLTSLALQVFIFFGAWWDAFYYVLNILVFVYKGAEGLLRKGTGCMRCDVLGGHASRSRGPACHDCAAHARVAQPLTSTPRAPILAQG
jgi:hypothetical protein